MQATLRIADCGDTGRAVAVTSLFSTAKLGEKIAPRQLKERVRRVSLHQGADYHERSLILLVVIVKIDGQIKARLRGHEDSIFNGVLQLADPFFLGSSRNTHKKSQNACRRGQGIDVVVVQAETEVCVGEVR